MQCAKSFYIFLSRIVLLLGVNSFQCLLQLTILIITDLIIKETTYKRKLALLR